jgi:DNA polymerase
MKAENKQIIYNLLKITSNYVHGYSDPAFSENTPSFTDVPQPAGTTAAILPTEGRPAAGITLTGIAAMVADCKRCGLCTGRRNSVPGEGVVHPAVLLVGEGPGAEEDATGIPFVGPAGKLLDKMMAAIALDRHKNCFIANIVKCRPPHNRDPKPEEAAACISFLEAQIQILHPAMILALGRVAAQNLLNTTAGIGQLRGTFHTYNDIPVLATYHPSALLRNIDLKRPAWEDLKLFRKRLLTIVPDYASGTETAGS